MQYWHMRDIVGLDLDSVLANTEYALDKYIREQFGIAIDWETECTAYDINTFPHLTIDMKEKIKADIELGVFLDDIYPYNYTEHAVNKLRINNIGVCIVTSRPYHMKEITMDWFEHHNIYYDGFVMKDSMNKWETVNDLHMKGFVEDRFDVLESINCNCESLPFGLYVIDHPWNRQYNSTCINRVNDISEAVDQIVNKRRDFYGKG